METMLNWLIGAFFNWLVLMIVIPIASRVAGFSFPGPKEAAGKLAIVVLATSGISVFLAPAIGLLASLLSLVVFWVALVKWFDVDLFGAVVIVVLNWFVAFLLAILLTALFSSTGL